MKTKIILAIIVAVSLLTMSCSKDGEDKDITQIDYEVGETYVRKFYAAVGYIGNYWEAGGVRCWSECGRLSLILKTGTRRCHRTTAQVVMTPA